MKCRVQFIGNIILDSLDGSESIDMLKRMSKDNLDSKAFMFSNFRYRFFDEDEK